MKTSYFVLLLNLLVLSCAQNEPKTESTESIEPESNMTDALVDEMQWMNQPESFNVEDSSLSITVDKGTDFFNNPEDSSVVGTAPYLYSEIEGDFLVKTLIQPDFSSQWNAVALMLHIDSLNWIKFAFENSDATGPSIVTVVTKGSSDDANGVILADEPMVWLAIARKGNIYAMHWSPDGENYKMARLTSMLDQSSIRIGVEAQSPVGDRATHKVHYFDIERKTIGNLRDVNE